ncbi:hypothetical protein QTP88_017519 [Uroleucon formosanum]
MTCIIQWNVNGFYKRSVDINRVLYELNPNIICLQETNFKNSHHPNLKNYTGYIKNRTTANRASGGVATFVKNNIESKEINIRTHLEAIVTLVELDKRIHICNIYIPDSTPFTISDIENITHQLPKPYIILGDFNSRNTSCGCNRTDPRGKTIEQVIENDQSLILLNNGDSTRHNSSNGSLADIDLTLSSSSLAPIMEWNVLNSYSGSDHWPVEIRVQSKNTLYVPSPKWNLSKLNWKLFAELIEEDLSSNPIDLSPPISQEQIDSKVNDFSNTIIRAANIAIGQKQFNNKNKAAPWWNEECRNAINKYKKALNRFKKTKNPNDHILLKKARAESRYITKRNKTLSWKDFTSSINHDIDPSTLWKKIRSLKGYKSHLCPDRLSDNNTFYDSPVNIAEAFAQSFKTNNSNLNYSDKFLSFKNAYPPISNLVPSSNEHSFNLPLNLKELLTVLQNSKSKSPGPDNIPNAFIQNLPEKGVTTLLQIFNSIWSQGVFPNQWRNATVIPIPKPNKNKFEINNYRPISLINTMSKILEKIINKRLIWYLESTNRISKHQCGFRRNHSTIDYLTTLHTDISSVLKRNQHLMLVSLDLQKAYDMVWRDRVLSILMKWDINDLMFKFLTNFLMNRSIRVKTHNTLSNLHPIENGLPQGSALSVTLFLVAINDIGKKLPFPVKYKLFADDCIIYCSGSNLTTSTQLIQEALNILSQWSSRTGFTFSPSKTQSIIFNKKNNYPSPQITLDKTPLLFTNNLRILGLIFDHKLSWKAHIRNLKSSCSTRMSIIKTLSNLTWGSDQNSLTLIYKSLILSLINYGSVIYGTTKRNLLNTLDPIHNQGIRLATGAFRTSPTDSILCNAGVPPLQFIRDINTTKYMIKTSNLPNHISSSNFHHPFPNFRSKTLNTIFENFNRIKENINLNIGTINKIPISSCAPWTWAPNINTELLKFNKNSTENSIIVSHFHELIDLHYHDDVLIYTDASKSSNGTGFAIVVGTEVIKFRLPSFISIYTAESYAIYKAVQYAASSHINSFLIISDSFSALISLQEQFPQNKLIQLTKECIISSKNKINFMWVPSHVDIHGNEKADTMADEAVTSESTSSITKSTTKDLINEAQKRILKSWQNHWDDTPTSNKLRNIKKTVTKWPYPINASRREQITINRARIGHSNITHSYLITKEPKPRIELDESRYVLRQWVLTAFKKPKKKK